MNELSIDSGQCQFSPAALTRFIASTAKVSQRNEYAQSWQILDADLTGMPCGPQAALAVIGYFAKQRYRRGRQ